MENNKSELFCIAGWIIFATGLLTQELYITIFGLAFVSVGIQFKIFK